MGVEAPIRIVLLDDDDGIAELLKVTFASDPRFELVGWGRNGSQARSLVQMHRPDAVLMDLEMPVMNGVEATRDLLNDNPSVCVIAFTASTDEAMKSAALSAGAISVLEKPFDPFLFLDAVERHAKACGERAA